MTTPVTNLSGRWDVDVEFFSSKSRHTLMLEQNGNQLQGTHKGDFTVRDLFGTIEGDQVKLRSIERSLARRFDHLYLLWLRFERWLLGAHPPG